MKLSDLRPPEGATKKIKRRGRGAGSGHGKTSCRGHKGAGARSGTKRRFGFEGGQMPLIRRIPKRGFTSKFRTIYQIVNLNDLERFNENSIITPDSLKREGCIKNERLPVKILGDGKITKPFTVVAHRFSKGAAEKIKKAGGKIQSVGQIGEPTSAIEPAKD